MSDPMNILLSTDGNYLPHVRTLLCSLHVNNPGERFRVYLLHRALEDDSLAGLASDVRHFAMHHLRSAGEIDLDWVMEHTSILHFCGKEKPWHERYRYRFGVPYKHYQHLTRRLLQTA